MFRLLAATSLLLACASEPDRHLLTQSTSGAVAPDTATIDGVLVMRQDSMAFDRAPRWERDTLPLVVFEDGGDLAFDLSGFGSIFFSPLMLSDGRMLAVGDGILLFGAAGRPERVLAPIGEGPGEVSSAVPFIGGWFLTNDTLGFFDFGNQRGLQLTADGGLADERPWPMLPSTSCASIAVPALVQDRLVVTCSSIADDPKAVRRAVRLALTDRWLSMPTDLARFPAPERRAVTVQAGRSRVGQMNPLAYGLWSHVTVQDSMIVIGTQERGFVIDFVDTAGVLRRQLHIGAPRRPVTAAMRNAWIQRALDRAVKESEHGGVPVEVLKADARATMFADSLPWHGALRSADDGILWIEEAPTLSDTTWTATAIGPDGSIVGRLTGPGGGNLRPVWFGRERVLVREEDDDGLVRFALYRIAEQ